MKETIFINIIITLYLIGLTIHYKETKKIEIGYWYKNII